MQVHLKDSKDALSDSRILAINKSAASSWGYSSLTSKAFGNAAVAKKPISQQASYAVRWNAAEATDIIYQINSSYHIPAVVSATSHQATQSISITTNATPTGAVASMLQLLHTAPASFGEYNFLDTACTIQTNSRPLEGIQSSGMHSLVKVAIAENVVQGPSVLAHATNGINRQDTRRVSKDGFGVKFVSGCLYEPRLVADAVHLDSLPMDTKLAAVDFKSQRVGIIGAFGGLGSLLKDWMISINCPELVLLGRKAVATGTTFSAAGAHSTLVEAAQCDITWQADAQNVFKADGGSVLDCIIHAGGVLQDASFRNQTAAMLRNAHSPKALGTLLGYLILASKFFVN